MTGRHAMPPTPVPAPDPFDALTVLEAAAYLEQMRQAAELVEAEGPLDVELDELAAELDELRADARSLFLRKFFEIN